MSAIVGVFDAAGRAGGEALARRLLARMARRGADRVAVWHDAHAALGVARHAWEEGAAFAGGALVVRDGACVAVADASLHYRADLRRRLVRAGCAPHGDGASHLVLAAYRAWGAACADSLEGDFAFVVWDAEARRVVCARDATGTRPLFRLEGRGAHAGAFALASTIDALRDHPACPGTLDLTAVGMDAAGLVIAASDATCWQGVREVEAATTLVRPLDGTTHVAAHWRPPVAAPPSRASFDDAAAELRGLLAAAVAERLDPAAPSCVWMSGGRDSTAIFGAGHEARRRGLAARGPLAVSARLRDDDPGCENGMIAAAAARWDVAPRWIDLDAVPLLGAADAASARDEPYAVEYEGFLRALVAETRAAGGRVALNGHGGDLLFGSSSVVMAEHLAHGRLGLLWREWRTRRRAGPRHFVKWAVEPLLPAPALAAIAHLRGRRLHGHYEPAVPTWIDRRFVREHDVEARLADATLHGARGDATRHEIGWLLTRRHFPRVMRTVGAYGLDGGVETRAPLMDRRVIAFALARPATDRRLAGDTKRLLRHAMRGLLPDEVLAGRPRKTGTFRGYFLTHFPAVLPLLRHCAQAPLLAELGIVDPVELRRVVERCATRSPGIAVGPDLLATLHTELWLRGVAAAGDRWPRGRAGARAPAAARPGAEETSAALADAVLSRGRAGRDRAGRPPGTHVEDAPCTRNRSWNASARSAS